MTPRSPSPGKIGDGPLFITVLALITLIGPLVLHMFFPATPGVKQAFGIDDGLAGLTNSIPLFTMAVFTLAYGSLSDRHGRRPLLLAGLTLFVIGSALSAVAPSIWMLLGGRFIQAVGAACGMALARAIARDVYGPDRLVKVLAYVLMAYAMGPMIAPPIGGLLADALGWRSLLIFAALVGAAVTVLVYATIGETHHDRAAQLGGLSFVRSYTTLFRNADFTAYVLQSGFCSGAFFSMAAAAAFLMSDYLDRPATEYGLYFLFFPAGYWIGNFLSSRLGGRVDIDVMVFTGAAILLLTSVGLAALAATGIADPLAIFIPGFLVTFAQGIALPNAQAGALSVAREQAGTAAGIGTFMQFFWAATFTQLHGILADGTPVPMAVTVAIAASLSFTAGAVPFLRQRRQQA